MNGLFKKHEVQFMAWTGGIFLLTVLLLSVFGLLPSEFRTEGGETFEQKTRQAVRALIDGQSATQANNGSKQADLAPYGTRQGAQQGTASQSNTRVTTVSNVQVSHNSSATKTINAENPTRLVIPSIGVDTVVVNPVSTKNEVLDAELTKGVVRYPGSGYPGAGNMFIFGHSSGLPVVQNKAYKVFNKVSQLKVGDAITVHGTQATYQYKVTVVKKVEKSKALVTFDGSRNMLTLSTCDSFGSDEDRYIVEADLVSVVLK